MSRLIRHSPVGVGNTLTIVGEITPPVLNSDVGDYNPVGFKAGVLIRQDVSSNNVEIGGFPPPASPDLGIFSITNVNSGSLDIRFLFNAPSATASWRILPRDNNRKSLKPNDTGWFQYDHSKARWVPANRIG